MKLLPLAAAALLASCTSSAPPGPVAGAITVVEEFYRTRKPFQNHGAPTATELASMRHWLSAELITLLARADSLRSAEMAAAPNEKPAFVEGDLFSSLFEGPTGFEVKAGEVTGAGGATDATGAEGASYRVPVHFTFKDNNTAQRWVDTVLVVTEGGRLVVSDVCYGGTWDFANKGSLVTSLNFSFVPTAADEGPR